VKILGVEYTIAEYVADFSRVYADLYGEQSARNSSTYDDCCCSGTTMVESPEMGVGRGLYEHDLVDRVCRIPTSCRRASCAHVPTHATSRSSATENKASIRSRRQLPEHSGFPAQFWRDVMDPGSGTTGRPRRFLDTTKR